MAAAKRNNDSGWADFLAIVLFIVGLFLFIGLIGSKSSSKQKELEPQLSEEEQLKRRLKQTQDRIKELEPQREELIRTEKRYFFWARFTIGCILLVVNGLYLFFDNWHQFDLGKQLNINAAIVLVYSFFAFILYGTPNRLVNAIKKKTSDYFLRKHKHIIFELQYLKEQEKEIIAYLNQYERK